MTNRNMIRHINQWKSFTLAVLFALMAHAATAQNEQLRDSLLAASDALDQHADSIDLRLKRASWHLLRQDWNAAKDDYDIILRKDPNNISALFYRAYANERLNRFSFARIDYNNLLKIVPGNFEAQLGLALLNQKDRHYTDAMDGINSLIEQYPTSAIAYAARAGMEQERGMLLLAEYDFSQAIAHDPENIDYVLQRMDVYALQQKWDAVRKDIEALRKRNVPFGRYKTYLDQLKRAKK